MKTLILLGLIFIGFTSHAQDKNIATENYPEAITSFVGKHFPNQTIESISYDSSDLDGTYEVELSDDIELSFNHDLKVTSIESPGSVPSSLIQNNIRVYVIEHFSQNKIVSWEYENNQFEIKLDNDYKLTFDLVGRLTNESYDD